MQRRCSRRAIRAPARLEAPNKRLGRAHEERQVHVSTSSHPSNRVSSRLHAWQAARYAASLGGPAALHPASSSAVISSESSPAPPRRATASPRSACATQPRQAQCIYRRHGLSTARQGCAPGSPPRFLYRQTSPCGPPPGAAPRSRGSPPAPPLRDSEKLHQRWGADTRKVACAHVPCS